jgi:two-component system CheB/CheR fusion protein
MIVDDYPDSAFASSMLLTILGYDCRMARTGREALVQVEAFDPGVVLLDIGLPDISGYEVARALRTRELGHPLYIAAVTGWGQAEDRVRSLAAGIDQHVIKPTNEKVIKQIMASAAERFATTSRQTCG